MDGQKVFIPPKRVNTDYPVLVSKTPFFPKLSLLTSHLARLLTPTRQWPSTTRLHKSLPCRSELTILQTSSPRLPLCSPRRLAFWSWHWCHGPSIHACDGTLRPLLFRQRRLPTCVQVVMCDGHTGCGIPDLGEELLYVSDPDPDPASPIQFLRWSEG
jgi:hypothetical protein